MWYPNTGQTEENAVIPTLGPTLGWAKEQAYNRYWPMIKTRIFAVRDMIPNRKIFGFNQGPIMVVRLLSTARPALGLTLEWPQFLQFALCWNIAFAPPLNCRCSEAYPLLKSGWTMLAHHYIVGTVRLTHFSSLGEPCLPTGGKQE